MKIEEYRLQVANRYPLQSATPVFIAVDTAGATWAVVVEPPRKAPAATQSVARGALEDGPREDTGFALRAPLELSIIRHGR